MLIDGDDLENSFSAHGDLCVIGSGPAGITIARALAGKGYNILLIEAGSLSPSPDSQAFYEGAVHGIEYPLSTSRTRAFGGSSNCWGGWCRQLERIEFESRPWMTYPGWPIAHSLISKYYSESAKILSVEGHEFSPLRLAKLVKREGHSICRHSDVIVPRIWQVSVNPSLGKRYEADIAKSSTLKLIYNTSAIQVAPPTPDGIVGKVCVKTRSGKQGIATAKRFVLALGGIETTRLLLNSATADGKLLGGYWLGRGFMEHPARINGWRIYVPKAVPRMLEEGGITPSETPKKNFRVAFGFGLSEKAQRHYKLPGFWGLLGNDVALNADEANTAKALVNSMGARSAVEVRAFDVTWAMEQRVNTESRIALDDTFDKDGLRRVSFSWKILPEDVSAANRIQNLRATDLFKRKIGRVRILKDLQLSDKDVDYGCHHIGATRMAISEKFGVVDKNSRVFGTKNLYLAGSGVFPTSTVTNPTLAVVALALRLSDHLFG